MFLCNNNGPGDNYCKRPHLLISTLLTVQFLVTQCTTDLREKMELWFVDKFGTLILVILGFCVGHIIFQLHEAVKSLRHRINPGLTPDYVPVGISNAKTPSALSAEYYYITMTVLSYLAALVLVVASISVCALIIVWCTSDEYNMMIKRTRDITRTMNSSVKTWNRQVGIQMSSLLARMNHGVRTHCARKLRKTVSSLRAGLLYMKHKIQRMWNAISTLIFLLMASLRKVSNKKAALGSDTELVLRRQLIEANEQLSQERDKSLCIICLDTPREVLLKPCKHYCSCSSCTSSIRECPICKQQIRETEVIYNA